MERRKFVIGLGALATGSAAATGTGAFSSMSASRSSDIDVVTDSDGLIALIDQTDSDIVNETSDGDLEIDFSAGSGDTGVNVNSTYRVGEGEPHQGQAFQIVNHDTVDHTVEISYQADTAGQSTNSQLTFRMNTEGTKTNTKTLMVGKGKGSNGNAGTVSYTISPTDLVNVQIIINAMGGEIGDDLSGTLSISASSTSQ